MKPAKYNIIHANFFNRSICKFDNEIQKDIVYVVQGKIDFFGEPQDLIRIPYSDYIMFKNTKKNNTYSFIEFTQFVAEIIGVGGAFFNKINNSFISFNLFDNVQIDVENPETLIIQLGRFGKIFFFQKSLKNYIEEITPKGKSIRYIGHTQIDNDLSKIRGLRRKKFFEIISQFKNTGFCKIRVLELKMYLGYIEVVDKDTGEALSQKDQLKFIFIPQDQFKFKDNHVQYGQFERDFLKPAIRSINEDKGNPIRNLTLFKKSKTGRKITHLEFRFDPLSDNLSAKELECIKLFEKLNLDRGQIVFLIKRIGSEEMLNRWIQNVDRRVHGENKIPKYYERNNQKEIENISGYLYKVLFKELN
ncbi:replication initiation protein [Nonlabens agnitus]|uniref:Uncharacterized protein n=1 Tax=Nonlabens agnitus TaxID=870484 RepID=A0A2S9WS35_9FLAO|nr:replication initiation protein [Nonlabens agnitus]PRP66279.1 hypothetical protein BST86_03820 [Nonlabens agnitus]